MTRRANRVSEAIGLAVAEGAGIAVIGFLGAELMLAPAGVSIAVVEQLAPAIVAGIGAGLYRFSIHMPQVRTLERDDSDRLAAHAKAAAQLDAPRASQSTAVAPSGLVSSG